MFDTIYFFIKWKKRLILIAFSYCLLTGQGESGTAGARGEPGLKGIMVSL